MAMSSVRSQKVAPGLVRKIYTNKAGKSSTTYKQTRKLSGENGTITTYISSSKLKVHKPTKTRSSNRSTRSNSSPGSGIDTALVLIMIGAIWFGLVWLCKGTYSMFSKKKVVVVNTETVPVIEAKQ